MKYLTCFNVLSTPYSDVLNTYCLDALDSLQNSFPCTLSVTSHSNFERNTLLILFYRCGNKSRVCVTFPWIPQLLTGLRSGLRWYGNVSKSIRKWLLCLEESLSVDWLKKERGEQYRVIFESLSINFLCCYLFVLLYFFFFFASLLKVIFPHKLLKPARISN